MRNNFFNHNENNSVRVKSAAVVFIKEKNGRYQVMREPFMLEKCVVSQDPDYTDVFEILEWSKESFLIKVSYYLTWKSPFHNDQGELFQMIPLSEME